MNENTPDRVLARILRHDGTPAGAGFLVSFCHVITCAHVVEDALGLPGKTSTTPGKTLDLDFPLMQNNKPVQAFVRQWHPVKEHPCPGLIEDIAVLEIIIPASVPEGARPVSFSKIAERGTFDLEVRMCGFPEGDDKGSWLTGMIRGKTGYGWYQIDHDPGAKVVTRGFSGAPVWDKQDWTVLGMIVCRKSREGVTTVYMIPRSTILSACSEIDFRRRRKPALGRIIPKMCNRDRQDEKFWDFFRMRYGDFPGQPQFYICYGEEGECHGSLIERLIDHRIKSYFKDKWKKSILPYSVHAPWRLCGDLKSWRETLARQLMEKLEPGYKEMDYSMKALCGLKVLKRYQLVMIIHDILVSEWNTDYGSILEWYLKDYWGGPEWADDVPQFLIFLNIRYTGSQNAGIIKRIFRLDRFFLHRIEKALIRVRESAGESCLLFPALESIESDDVHNWFFRNMSDIDESERMEKIRSIFKGKQRVCMAEIEKEIKVIYDKYQQKMSGLYE